MWLVPALTLVLCILGYGLLIPWLGYYWDDWIMMLALHSQGPGEMIESLRGDRPLLGWLYALTTSLLGESIVHWHLFALLTRWLGAVAVWWCLRGVWPEREREAATIASLFALYPGFSQQPIAWSYSHHFIVLLLVVFSLGAMIWAMRKPRLYWLLTVLALLSSALSLMTIEYHVGIELLRPVLIFLVLTEKQEPVRQRLRSTLMRWSPYLAVLGTFLIWRLLFFHSGRAETDQVRLITNLVSDPFREVSIRLVNAFSDLIEAGVLAWGQTLPPDFFAQDRLWVTGLVLTVIFASFVAMYYCLARIGYSHEIKKNTRSRWAKQAILIGLFGIIAGQLVPWFAQFYIELNSLNDRFALPAMLGACILLGGLIHLIRGEFQRIILICLIVGLASGFHFRNANRYRQDWLLQKSLFWQLSWRVPGLKPGTSVLIDDSPTTFPRSYSLAAPLNFTYSPQRKSAQLDYWFFILSKDLGDEVPSLSTRVPLSDAYRRLSFRGSTSDSLVVWFSPPGCLKILDPRHDELPQLPPVARAARPLSNLDRIIVEADPPARPPAEVFGPEPEACWCYYFQKAELARQVGNWQEVARLGDEVRDRYYKPEDVTEWLPFVEGYTHVGRYEDARDIITVAMKATPRTWPVAQAAYRAMYERLENTGSDDTARLEFISEMKGQLLPLTQ